MRSPVRPGQLGFAAQYRWEIPRGAGLQAWCCARLCLGLPWGPPAGPRPPDWPKKK